MLVPFAPDDIVCLVELRYFFKEFMKIVLLLKFWSVAIQLLNVVFVSIIWHN